MGFAGMIPLYLVLYLLVLFFFSFFFFNDTANTEIYTLSLHDALPILSSYFDEVHTACEVGVGKPAPDLYLFVAEKLGVAPEHCLVFEDICKGIQAGKSAGMRVCAVSDEYSSTEEKKKAELADYFIDTYLDFGL